MFKFKSIIFIVLLTLIHPGCLFRHGEGSLHHLLSSVKDLEERCEKENEMLTEGKIKDKLGRPGWLKPVYENKLDLSLLNKLKEDSGILLKPYPLNLYNDMLNDKDKKGLESVRLLSYIYDKTGQEDASLTFYIGNYTNEDMPKVIGWDYVKYDHSHLSSDKKVRKVFINYKINTPSDYLRLPYTFLVNTIIGLKQFVGEIIKSPISFVETEFLENIFRENKIPFYNFDGFKSAFEDWRNGVTALTHRHRIDGKQGILETTQNVFGEIPIIGPLFDQWHKKETDAANRLFLTRGIYGGNNTAQNTTLWVHFLTNCKEDQADKKRKGYIHVKAIPYRYGSAIDIIWSMLNISHGFAYDMASEIVLNYDVRPGDSVHLSGHSGGVQRIVSAARILNDNGIKVDKMFGIAGPALGYAPCNKIETELNGKMWQDKTSDEARILSYLTFDLLTNIKWKYNKDVNERHKHRTPGFIDGKTRLKYDGYLSEYLKGFFR